MKYYFLTAADPPIERFLFFEETQKGREVRARYLDLKCPKCGKFNEYEALSRGVDSNVKPKAKRDFMGNFDFCYYISPKFLKACKAEGIEGIRPIEIPGSIHFVLLPTVVVKTDILRSKMQLIGDPCSACGRYRETCFNPSVSSMELPSNPMTFFSPNVRTEKNGVAMCDIIMTEQMMLRLKPHKLTGIDWLATNRSEEIIAETPL